MRKKFYYQSIFILLICFTFNNIQASKVRALNKSKEFRKETLLLRYNQNDSRKARYVNLEKILKKDCRSFSYSKNDFDLTVQALLLQYPMSDILSFLNNRRSICPTNFEKIVRVLIKRNGLRNNNKNNNKNNNNNKIINKNINDITTNYLKQFKNVQTYPARQFIWNYIMIINLGIQNCGKKEVLAVQHFLCGYSKQEATRIMKALQKKCLINLISCWK